VCKYRKKLLYGELDVFLKAIISNIEQKSDLKQHFWKENTFWTDGYFVCSIGEASPETMQRYIQNQG